MPTAPTAPTTRLPRFLTAATTAAAALAATAPFSSAVETIWNTDKNVIAPVSVPDHLFIDGTGTGPVVNVTAPGTITTTGVIHVGRNNLNKGTLNITDGGIVSAKTDFIIGHTNGSEGMVTVSGENSTLNVGNLLSVGNYSKGRLDISSGGTVYAPFRTRIGGDQETGNGTLNLLSGGTLATGFIERRVGSAVFNLKGGTIRATADSEFFFRKLGTLTLDNTGLEPDAPALTIDTNGHNIISSSEIPTGIVTFTGSGGLAKTGSGTLTLTYAHTYTGNTTVSGGILEVTGTLGTDANYSSAIVLETPGTLTFNQTANQTISGTISGTGNLTKTGGGTLTLTGTNTYTGTTTVSGGILKVLGTLNGGANHAGQIVLSNNGEIVFHQTGEQTFSGVLSGTGTIAFDTAKSVVIASTGTLNPGSAGTPGTLTFQNTSDVSFSTGARVVIDLVTLADGGSDLLIIDGGKLVLDGAQLVLQRGKTFPLWSPKGGSEIVIAHVENGGQIEGMFANVGVDAKTNKMTVTDTAGRRLFVSVRANSDGGQDLLLTMFPEPSTYALLGGTGVLLLALFRKRRRQPPGRRTGNAGL